MFCAELSSSAIKRVLVANRGEIASRVIKSLNLLNIDSVAVFADSDAGSPYVDQATRSIYIGAAAGGISPYLDGQRIIQIALELQVDAIHPGSLILLTAVLHISPPIYTRSGRKLSVSRQVTDIYRRMLNSPKPSSTRASSSSDRLRILFLRSETRCVGFNYSLCSVAHSHSLVAVSYQAAAKTFLAANTTIPLVPGYSGSDQSLATLIDESRKVGYPLLIKASAGGGGKGMRIVYEESA